MMTEERLAKLVDEIRPELWSGAVSTYLPQLAEARIDDFSVSLELGPGKAIAAGDDRRATFTMQSVVKVFTLLLALRDHGEEHVFARVGRDQAVGAFNSLDTFDATSGVPVNPFVNSGALTVVDMLEGEDSAARVTRVLELMRRLTGNPGIDVDLDVARAEFSRSDRNRAICYLLRSLGLVTSEVEDLLWAYCQLCAIEVSVTDLARTGSCLAHDELIESVDELPPATVVHALRRLMLTTGMYVDSGRYAYEVGIPAKCGVSGAMLGIVPGVGGIGIYGPALDVASNSIGGVRLMGSLSTALDLR